MCLEYIYDVYKECKDISIHVCIPADNIPLNRIQFATKNNSDIFCFLKIGKIYF